MATKPKNPVPLMFDSSDKIKRFQTSQGLTADGIWGPKSASAYSDLTSNGTGWLDTMQTPTPSAATASGSVPSSLTNPISSLTPTVPTSSGTTPNTMSRIGSAVNDLAPFASNIVNAFRKPPGVPAPVYDDAVTLRGVDYSSDRADVDNAVRGSNLGAERSLSGNTSTAVRASNMARQLEAKSRINQAETNTNTEIGNRQSLINSEISSRNNAKKEAFNNNRVEREIAIQANQSANIANAADKYTAIQNEKAKRELDEKKFGVLSRMYDSGVLDRMGEFYKNNGIDDPLNTKKKKAFGGTIKNLKKAY